MTGKKKSNSLSPDAILQVVTDAHEKIWTIKSFAEERGTTTDAVRMRIQRGLVPARKVGHRWFILKSEYLNFLKSESSDSL